MVPGTAYKNYCHCRSWKEIGDFKFFTTVCGLSRSSLLSVIHKGWSDLGKSLHPQWCVMMSGGHHVARSRYMLEWQDHGLEAHEFQAEFVPVSQICKPEADTGALVVMWGAVSWSHPGDRHKWKHWLLLLLQSTEMRQEQDNSQQLLAVTAVTRIITADAPGHKQPLQWSLLTSTVKQPGCSCLCSLGRGPVAWHSEVAASVTYGSFQPFYVCLLKKLVLLAGRGRM